MGYLQKGKFDVLWFSGSGVKARVSPFWFQRLVSHASKLRCGKVTLTLKETHCTKQAKINIRQNGYLIGVDHYSTGVVKRCKDLVFMFFFECHCSIQQHLVELQYLGGQNNSSSLTYRGENGIDLAENGKYLTQTWQMSLYHQKIIRNIAEENRKQRWLSNLWRSFWSNSRHPTGPVNRFTGPSFPLPVSMTQ